MKWKVSPPLRVRHFQCWEPVTHIGGGIGRVVGLKPIGSDDYVLAIEDVRDERVHVGRTPRDFEPWLRSVKEGRHVLPAFGLCGRCGEIHCDRDWDLELFRTCIPCQAELVEVGLELQVDPPSVGP